MSRSKAWFGALAVTLAAATVAACSSSGTAGAPRTSDTTSTSEIPGTTEVPSVSTTEAPSTAAGRAAGPTTTAPAAASEPAASGGPAAASDPAVAYAGPGPYPVGVVNLAIEGRPVTLWYPAVPGSDAGLPRATYDVRTLLPAAEQAKVAGLTSAVGTMDAVEGLPVAPGPFPIVLFSHGFAGYRYQSTFLTTALASWGFAVAAPEHTARDLTAVLEGRVGSGQSDLDDLRQTLALLTAQNADPASLFAGRFDPSKVAAIGHSAGGGAAFQLADDPTSGVGVAVGLAPAVAADRPVLTRPLPSLMLAGTADAIIPVDRVRQAWHGVAGSGRLVELGDVTHLGFSEICTLAADHGGVLTAAQQAGVIVPDLIVRLFADGCDAKYGAPDKAFSVVRHLTIAELRSALGIDVRPVGLDPSIASAYAPLPITFQPGA